MGAYKSSCCSGTHFFLSFPFWLYIIEFGLFSSSDHGVASYEWVIDECIMCAYAVPKNEMPMISYDSNFMSYIPMRFLRSHSRVVS